MYRESESEVKEIDLEIRSGSKSVADRLTVDGLPFVAQVKAEHTERDIKRDILHHKNTYTR